MRSRWNSEHGVVPRFIVVTTSVSGTFSSVRAFVTGMTGFVGRHLVAELLADGAEIVGTLLPDGREVPPEGTAGVPVVLTDADEVASAMAEAEPDVIFHLAGAASVSESFRDPEGTWLVNVEGTRSVLDAALRSAPGARVVVALSGEEYGRVPLDQLPVTEDTPLNPVSPYAKSKAAADLLCAERQSRTGQEIVRLRAFNQIGPGQDPRFVLPSVCKQIADAEMAGTPCRLVLGNLDSRRDFVDVRDVVAAYRLLSHAGDPRRPYLAGSGRSRSIQELVDLAVGLARIPVEIRADPSRVREGEQPDLYASPRALVELGWRPRVPLAQSVRDTLDYWRARAHMEVS